jgi:branched-chain amino acid transport system substrate-binding protein
LGNMEISRRALLGGSAMGAMALVLAACSRDGGSTSTGGSGATKPLLALSTGALSFAACLPISGAFTTVTVPWAAALRYAAEERNAAGGLRIKGKSYKVNAPLIDEGYAAAPALASAQKFFSQGGHYVGGLVSEEAPAALLGVNTQADALINTCINGTPALSKNSLRFFHDALNQATGDVRARFAYKELGLRKIATIELKNSWGASYQETFAAAFTELGGKIVARDYMDVTETDFTSRISAWKAFAPDGIYIIIGNSPGVTIATQATQLGFDTQPFLLEGAWDPNVYKSTGASFMDRSYYLAQHPYCHTTPEGTALAKKLYDDEHLFVTNWFWQGYDSTRMVLDAMESANSTDPRDVIQALPAAITAGADKWLIKATGGVATKDKGVFLQTPVWMSKFRSLDTDFVSESPLVAVNNAAYAGVQGWLPKAWKGYTQGFDKIVPVTSGELQKLGS